MMKDVRAIELSEVIKLFESLSLVARFYFSYWENFRSFISFKSIHANQVKFGYIPILSFWLIPKSIIHIKTYKDFYYISFFIRSSTIFFVGYPSWFLSWKRGELGFELTEVVSSSSCSIGGKLCVLKLSSHLINELLYLSKGYIFFHRVRWGLRKRFLNKWAKVFLTIVTNPHIVIFWISYHSYVFTVTVWAVSRVMCHSILFKE